MDLRISQYGSHLRDRLLIFEGSQCVLPFAEERRYVATLYVLRRAFSWSVESELDGVQAWGNEANLGRLF